LCAASPVDLMASGWVSGRGGCIAGNCCSQERWVGWRLAWSINQETYFKHLLSFLKTV